MSTRRKMNRDLTLLSVYLDHALRESEQRKLEARLAQAPELREQLENLRRTKIILGFLPRLKAPRNFTLTPDMITVRKPRQPLLITFQYATAIAAILLVVLFGVEGITNLPRNAMTQSSDALEESMVFEAEGTPEPLILWGGASDSSNGGGDTKNIVTEEIAVEIAPEAEEEEEIAAVPEEPAEEIPEESAEEGLTAEATPQATEEPNETTATQRGTGDDEGDDLILGLNPEEGGQTIDKSASDETTAESPSISISPLRWLEIGLALIVLCGGISLLLLRKRSR